MFAKADSEPIYRPRNILSIIDMLSQVRRVFPLHQIPFSNAANIFFVALAARLIALLPPLVSINPYNKADATQFTAAAITAANDITKGQAPPLGGANIEYDIWGLILSPFYMVPGPHWIYSHVAVALLGATAVYFVVEIVRKWASQGTAVLAGFPLAVYPSVVFVQTALIRDVGVLFGLTAGTWLVVVSEQSSLRRATLATLAFGFAAILRFEVVLLIGAGVAVGLITWIGTRYRHGLKTGIATAVIGTIVSIIITISSKRVVHRFMHLRENRAKGRTAYMTNKIPETGVDLVFISVMGLVYFYSAPLDPVTTADYVVFIEGMINIGFILAVPIGLYYVVPRYPIVGIPLGVALIGGSLVWAAGTVNAGTAVRHRQMFIWLVFIFGAVGIHTLIDYWRTERV